MDALAMAVRWRRPGRWFWVYAYSANSYRWSAIRHPETRERDEHRERACWSAMIARGLVCC